MRGSSVGERDALPPVSFGDLVSRITNKRDNAREVTSTLDGSGCSRWLKVRRARAQRMTC
jgi:predicted DNA-binding ribbon-helix-helix protein